MKLLLVGVVCDAAAPDAPSAVAASADHAVILLIEFDRVDHVGMSPQFAHDSAIPEIHDLDVAIPTRTRQQRTGSVKTKVLPDRKN